MAHTLTLVIPITETRAHGNVYHDLGFEAMTAATDLPVEEREVIVEALSQGDYIYTDLGRDLLTKFLQA